MAARRPARKPLAAGKGSKSETGKGRGPMSRIAWGMAVLIALLVAMSLLSGRLRSSTSAGESLSASGKGDTVAAEGTGSESESSETGKGETATADTGGGDEPSGSAGGVGGTFVEAALEKGDAVADEGGDPRESGIASGGAGVAAKEDPATGSVEGEGGYLSLEGEGGETPELGASLVKVLLSLGVVVLLVLATRAFLKRSRSKSAVSGGDTYLEVLGYTRLGNGTGVHEVRVGERVWFIAEGEKELRLLGEFDLSELELSRCLGRDGERGDFARELDGDLAAGTAEWRGTMPRGWLNALRWKTAR